MSDGFELVRSQPVTALNLTVEEYSHPSGAKHFHLANDYVENVFMVAFRTVPHDSSGVAHILEHTALCGSEKFPVRDPFFLMIRRSLNSFMNAFTTSDYTAYPFASQNRKDYFNLLEVYLDAVFFSRLDKRDFLQEGHRVEFESPEDPSSPLVYKGVVYNEMKGDTSSPMSMLYHGIQQVLYPTSTYHFNSGGDPASIPDLSYESLVEFYRTHYHPSNAIFMTFGDIDAQTQQRHIAEMALNRLDVDPVPDIAVQPEHRYSSPVNHEFSYPVDDDDLSQKTHIVLGWLLGRNTDLKLLLKCHLLSDVLLDTSASPLRLALETTPLARAVSPMSGFEEDHMEMNFMCGVEGSEAEHADEIESLILDVLNDVVQRGVSLDRLEAVLHQLELSQREIGGDGWPYGLQLIFSCMSAAVHRGDPIGLLDIDTALSELRQEIRDPDFFPSLVRTLLVENTHRVRVIMKPDRGLASRLLAQEKSQLADRRQAMTREDIAGTISQAQALQARQAQEEDLSVLPQVTREDIPAEKHFPELARQDHGHYAVTAAGAGTNGITYHQIVTPVSALSASQYKLLPVYSQLVTELGSADRDYLQTQHLQHSVSGGISAYFSLRSDLDNCQNFRQFYTLSSRTLNNRSAEMALLLKETRDAPRFDELDRVRELAEQLSIRRLGSIASSGHQYAMAAAAASLRPASYVSDQMTGVAAVMQLRHLVNKLDDRAELEKLAQSLQALNHDISAAHYELLLIADSDYLPAAAKEVEELWTPVPQQQARADEKTDHGAALAKAFTAASEKAMAPAFVVTTQVNYCATAFSAVAEGHDDCAALSVLAGVLRNGYLHAEIREKGGAYGGGAGHDSSNGIFRFYSYRDPRINETFDIFSRSIDWVLNTTISDAMIEESVLGIISSIDAPGSPAGELRQSFHHAMFGRSASHRALQRARYLSVRQADLKRVASRYLQVTPTRALVTSEQRLPEIDAQFQPVFVNLESQ